jgi:glycine/serine hydroxymethyltransferase
MTEKDMPLIANWIKDAVNVAVELLPIDFKNPDQKVSKEARSQYKNKLQKNAKLKAIRKEIKEFCNKYPLP